MAKMENGERLFSPFSEQWERSCEPSAHHVLLVARGEAKRAPLERSLGGSADPMTPAQLAAVVGRGLRAYSERKTGLESATPILAPTNRSTSSRGRRTQRPRPRDLAISANNHFAE